jgi:hypothetical protein
MKKGIVIAIIGILCATAATVMFIRESNDHSECSLRKYTKTENGMQVTYTTHVCKEKYSF